MICVKTSRYRGSRKIMHSIITLITLLVVKNAFLLRMILSIKNKLNVTIKNNKIT